MSLREVAVQTTHPEARIAVQSAMSRHSRSQVISTRELLAEVRATYDGPPITDCELVNLIAECASGLAMMIEFDARQVA